MEIVAILTMRFISFYVTVQYKYRWCANKPCSWGTLFTLSGEDQMCWFKYHCVVLYMYMYYS